MSSVNKVIIIGNLGADPEVRQFNNGGSVTNIAVATSERWTDKQSGEKKELTEWHRIALFNRLGEVAAQYLRKGSKVYIEGSLRTHKYQDKSGQDRYSTEIRANEMVMLDSAGGGQNQNTGFGNQSAQQGGYSPNNQNNQGAQNNFAGQQSNNQSFQQGGYNQGSGAPSQGMQGGSQNGFNNSANAYNQPNQFNKPASAPTQPKPTVMPDGPVDDDIPF